MVHLWVKLKGPTSNRQRCSITATSNALLSWCFSQHWSPLTCERHQRPFVTSQRAQSSLTGERHILLFKDIGKVNFYIKWDL